MRPPQADAALLPLASAAGGRELSDSGQAAWRRRVFDGIDGVDKIDWIDGGQN